MMNPQVNNNNNCKAKNHHPAGMGLGGLVGHQSIITGLESGNPSSYQHHGQKHLQPLLNFQAAIDQRMGTITLEHNWDQYAAPNYTAFSAFGLPSSMSSYTSESFLASCRTLPAMNSMIMSTCPYPTAGSQSYTYHMQQAPIPIQYSSSTTGNSTQDPLMIMNGKNSNVTPYPTSQHEIQSLQYAMDTYNARNSQQYSPQTTSQLSAKLENKKYYPSTLQTNAGTPEPETSKPSTSSHSKTRATSAGSSVSRRNTRGAPASKFDTSDFNFAIDAQGKPQHSYATIITYALQTTPNGQMTLNDIYEWVMNRYSYFKTAGSGWKNSIRHNLSLNRAFVRVPRPSNEGGKGSYWKLDFDYIADYTSSLRTPRSVSDPSFGGGRARSATDLPALYRNKGDDDGGDSSSRITSAPTGRTISEPQFSGHKAEEICQLKQDDENQLNSIMSDAILKDLAWPLRCQQEAFNDENKVQIAVQSVTPVDHQGRIQELKDIVSEYQRMG